MHDSALFQPLDDAGLNLQAVFNLTDLPDDVRATLALGAVERCWSQLLLIGHGGPRLWSRLQQQGMSGADPIDRYSVEQISAWFRRQLPQHRFTFCYPGSQPVALQRLGELAGWHYPSPFRVGVNDTWGSWFAYRAVVLADTRLPPGASTVGGSPCLSCIEQPCVDRCAGQTLRLPGRASVDACLAFRLAEASPCAQDCPARRACPQAPDAAYSDAQLQYHYRLSLATLQRWAEDR